ncbi:MAG: hypothetical protein JXB47_18280 [Anaerolineae bacterium]|nr:hypothetical protein [Anaerolineae bacterium]
MRTRFLHLLALVVLCIGAVTGGGALAQDGPGDPFVPITPDNVAQLGVVTDLEHPFQYIQVLLSPDSKSLAYETYDGGLILRDLAYDINKMPQTGYISSFDKAFSPDGTLLALATAEGSPRNFILRIWDIQTLTELTVLRPPGLGEDMSLAVTFSPDGQYLAAVGKDGQVWLWNATALRENPSGVEPTPFTTVNGHANSLVFSTDGALLAVSYGSHITYNLDTYQYEFVESENFVRVWNLAENAEVFTISDGLDAGVQGIAFSPDGRMLAAAVCGALVSGDECSGSRLHLWSTADGALLRTLVDYEADVTGRFFTFGPVFSPDGTILAIGTRLWDASGSVHFWDPATGELRASAQGSEPVYFNADGSLVAFLGGDECNSLRLWDTTTWQEVYAYDAGPGTDIARGMWSLDGALIAFSVSDSTTRMSHVMVLGIPNTAYVAPTGTSTYAKGVSAETIEARFGDGPEICVIETGEALLAVAHSPAGDVLVYAGGPGCEGPVWIPAAGADWGEAANLSVLATIPGPEPYEQLPPLDYLPEGWQVCTDAQGWAPFPEGAPKLTVQQVNERTREQARKLIPAEYLATRPEEVNILLCEGMRKVPYETCYYTGGVTATRMRYDKVMMLVNYETGGIIAETTYRGGDPDPCPQYVSAGGDRPGFLSQVGPETWAPWAVEQLEANAHGSHAVPRTVVNVDALNARAEPSTESEILQKLAFNTPVNLIARNEAGDWAAALLPDMSQAWLFVDLLKVAPQTDIAALPVAAGPAVDVIVPSPRP